MKAHEMSDQPARNRSADRPARRGPRRPGAERRSSRAARWSRSPAPARPWRGPRRPGSELTSAGTPGSGFGTALPSRSRPRVSPGSTAATEKPSHRARSRADRPGMELHWTSSMALRDSREIAAATSRRRRSDHGIGGTTPRRGRDHRPKPHRRSISAETTGVRPCGRG